MNEVLADPNSKGRCGGWHGGGQPSAFRLRYCISSSLLFWFDFSEDPGVELHGENSFCSESQDSNLDSSQPGHCITFIELLGGLKRMVHTEQS